jgi:type II secretory pathway pseudopilin PulG
MNNLNNILQNTKPRRAVPGRLGCTHHSQLITRNCGFTLVELLVVIAILILLLGILAPAVMKAYVGGLNSKTQATINLLAGGCEAYNTDFGEYPNSSNIFWDKYKQKYSSESYVPNINGQYLLPLWLTGYADGGNTGYMTKLAKADGKDGFGYRTVKKGPVKGPYNGAEEVAMAKPSGSSYLAFQDAFDNNIYYYSVHGLSGNNYSSRTWHNGDNPDSLNLSSLDKAMEFYILSAGADGEYDPTASDTDDISNVK